MKRLKFFMLVLAVIVLPSAAVRAQQEYVIGEGDLLKISVYDHGDLTTQARVSAEGRVSFPLIGEVELNNLTIEQAEKKIARLLGEGYIVGPHVSILIEEYKSKKVTVLGDVAKPGLVILRGKSTLLDVISDAGGITSNAGDTLTIQRKINNFTSSNLENKDIIVAVDLKRLLEDGDANANVAVYEGDNIYVPRAAFVYVNGEVRTPGAYKVTKGLTVLKSITLAGGFTEKASGRRTKIVRKTDKGETTIRVKMDDLVMPDDIIMVPESYF